MKLYDVEVGGRRVRISRATGGRVAVAVERFVMGLPAATTLLFAFFMLDVLGPEPFDTERVLLYLASAVGLAALFALAWAVAGAMRHEEWVIDFGTQTITYETRLSMGSPQGVEVDTSNLLGVRVQRKGLLRRSKVELVFTESVEVAASTLLGPAQLEETIDALRNLAETEALEFED